MIRPFVILREPDAGTGNAGAPAPQGGTAPAATPPANAAPPAAPPKPASGPTKAELLAEVLKEFGAASADEVKAALALRSEVEAAKKSDAEKLASLTAELEATKKSASTLGDVLKAQVAGELGKLTAEQRAAVIELAGDDPAKQILTITKLRPTWTAAPPPPATTAPPTGASPPPAGSAGKVDEKTQYEELQKRNPFLAANFIATHPRALG